MADKKVALVLGGTGMVGRNLIMLLDTKDDWETIAVSRRAPYFKTKARHISCDMNEPDDCAAKLAGIDDVTHVFFCGHATGIRWAEKTPVDTDLFRHSMDAALPNLPNLQHVCLMQGSKYYGRHLGPFKTPAREEDPRHMPPNFYYTQQDYLMELASSASWGWSCARPHIVTGYARTDLNLTKPIAVYATISKELGLPLRYPGNEKAYRAMHCASDVELLARSMEWMATTPECAGEAFNVVNGDYFRWENMWPKIADYFEMDCGPVQEIDLELMMGDKAQLWDEIIQKHGLMETPWEEAAHWGYANYAFAPTWDVILESLKLRKFGFHDYVDSEEMFMRIFDNFRRDKFIP
ncbi:MAG: NAD-dependent dehydratase [Alphaproteobacteria bacterium]|nr:NAD-dependent dehydratase [Alphaproteobacteria bacterium]|tara:strand:- start:3620 stop:4672 length:1053 start_codon:yes stop_codon:yes gene_type:complete